MSRGTPVQRILHIDNAVVSYGPRSGVDGITLDVDSNEIVGLIGPNGAGKTTTLRLLLGSLRPRSGAVRVLDRDPWRDRPYLSRVVAGLLEAPGCYGYLTGRQNLEVHAWAIGGVRPAQIDRALHLVGLNGRDRDRAKTYSFGMRQRLSIAQALLGDTRLLLLDEPTNGLDPQGIAELRELIRAIREEMGASIVISSHALQEVQAVCDRVVVIARGRVVGSMALSGRIPATITVQVLLAGSPGNAADQLRRVRGVKATHSGDQRLWVEANPDFAIDQFSSLVAELGGVIEEITTRAAPLEAFYLETIAESHH